MSEVTNEERNAVLAPFAADLFDQLLLWYEGWQNYEMVETPQKSLPRLDRAILETETLLRELKLRLGE